MTPWIQNPYVFLALPLIAFAALGLCAAVIERQSPPHPKSQATPGLDPWEREQRRRNLAAMEKREASLRALGDEWVLRPDRCELPAALDAGAVELARKRKTEWKGAK